MKLTIVTPEAMLYNDTATSVTLPGVVGQFTVLPGHALFVSQLKKGKIVVGSKTFAIADGFAEVQPDAVTVLCTSGDAMPDR